MGFLKAAALIIGGLILMSTNSQPRGLRNNNPGNIRANDAYEWQGQIGVDSGGFVIFDTPENGLRALARTLRTYRKNYGINTIEGVISRYAPPSENNTEAYIAHAERALSLSRYAPLNSADYPRLMTVIVAHENGQQPYTMATINEGFQRGFA